MLKLLFAVALAALAVSGSDTPPPTRPPIPSAAKGSHEFSPGIEILWERRMIVAEGAVVLREGPLELFACSARTREHESIMVIRARPLHLYQAMGLVGLTPGEPVRYDEAQKRWCPPTGDALELRVRYQDGGIEYTVPVERWMASLDVGRTVPELQWVFAGSRLDNEGRFGTDLDGTVVSVVDFESALIAISSLHSAENEQLWLSARTPAIPPVGTKCKLLVRRKPNLAKTVQAAMTSEGTLRLADSEVSAEDMAARLRIDGDAKQECRLIVDVASSTPSSVVESLREQLLRAGVDAASIEFHPPEPADRPRQTSQPKSGG